MMRTLILSTVVIALALLGMAPVAAQSSDEAAVAQAVEAFRNATLKADRAQFTALTAGPRTWCLRISFWDLTQAVRVV
jgi:type II secretory pathway pseudopilin PulG